MRPDVKFQDGSPFTAEDVVFTFDRAAKVPNSPSPFTSITRQMTQLEIVDPLTLRIHTAAAAPTLPLDLSSLPILSHIAAAGAAPEGKTTAELNRGEGLVGTGPFKFIEWQRGAQLVLARNDSYWGPKPAWEKVIFRPLTSGAVRVAALLAGDIDLIEDPPTADLGKLRKEPKIVLAEAVSGRMIYIALDQFAEPSPGIPDTAGKNPLKDKRVRAALSMAIDRKGLVDKIMEGIAMPAGDFLPWPAFGTNKATSIERFDPGRREEAAGRSGLSQGILDHAGHAQRALRQRPQGGAGDRRDVEPHRGEDRSGGDRAAGVLQEPRRIQVQRLSRQLERRFRRDVQSAARAGRHAQPREGHGRHQPRPYSNPAMDAKLEEALRTVDDKKRETLLQEASKLVISDYGVLPLYFELSFWAMRKGLAYAGRADQMTLAQFVTVKK